MYKWLIITLFLSSSSLLGCSFSNSATTVARTGTAGSTSGAHIIKMMQVTDIQGGGASFAYGAISGYAGASADIGHIGIPSKIKGYWSKGWDTYEKFYHLSATIDSNLAKQKIEALRNYYKNHKTFNTTMQLVVDGPRVRLYYTMNCFSYRMDCSPKENADPNGWVIHQSNDATQLVLLFDGTGEASDIPFPGSPYDK
ncbi:hypothetical protein [Photobacterium halotolerans]|uniref:Lipoprotein n=2 Tax=Photobacterium TaxID=657 RepID=A0A7X4WAR2_9GAMM|nr:hypothetical protein [Photobacterium halotolerans]NAW65316.1 hypothetical protein [Photobacterium halotolerans]